MKKVLVYGDSNVWGDNFITGKRIPDQKQWVNILKNKLEKKYIFFQEGLPGRIAGMEEIDKKYKNGQECFVSTFKTLAPLDLIIIALGTNDLQIKYNKSSKKIIEDLLWYQETIYNLYQEEDNKSKYFVDQNLPEILYILPINFDYKNNAKEIFDKKSEQKRLEILNFFEQQKIKYLSSNDMSLFQDGIHLNYDGHEKLANMVEGIIELNDQI